jgi:hypothetical protein
MFWVVTPCSFGRISRLHLQGRKCRLDVGLINHSNQLQRVQTIRVINSKIHYGFHMRPPLDIILSQMNRVYTITPISFRSILRVIFSSHLLLGLPSGLLFSLSEKWLQNYSLQVKFMFQARIFWRVSRSAIIPVAFNFALPTASTLQLHCYGACYFWTK